MHDQVVVPIARLLYLVDRVDVRNSVPTSWEPSMRLREGPGCIGIAKGSAVLDKVRRYVSLSVGLFIGHDVLASATDTTGAKKVL